MIITIYGIKNCDTMQKAFKWLDARKLPYAFHNYKEAGIDKATIETWLQHFPTDKVINTKSTTYRTLTNEEKTSITNKAKAIAIMIKSPSIIKRPVWDFGDGEFLIGFDEETLRQVDQKL